MTLNTTQLTDAAVRALGWLVNPRQPARLLAHAAVRRLDRAESYYLLLIQSSEGVSALVALSEVGGLLQSALMPDGAGAWPVLERADALRRVQVAEHALVELVWAPSAASMSMFHPFWRIVDKHQCEHFVTAQGEVLQALLRPLRG